MYDPEILLSSPAFLEKVCAHVAVGASPHIAARFEGMKERDYWRFWEEGKKADEKPEQERTEQDEFLVRLVDRIELALADARMNAEKRVWTNNPAAYLRYGSGREGGAEARGWESGLDREKSLFASSPLKYLLEGAGQPGRETRIGWTRGRGGRMIPHIIPEEFPESSTQELINRVLYGEGDTPPASDSEEEISTPIAPPPLGEGGTETARSAQSKDPGEGPLPPLRGTLSQGERGSEGERSPFKGPGP